MKKSALFGLVLAAMFAMLVLTGCSKSSEFEGKVVDAKGRPVAGVKVIANQLQPIKGYERFDTLTGADGTFKFSKLLPDSDYNLSFYPYNEFNHGTVAIKSAPKGETAMLPAPFVVRFQFSPDGTIVLDTVTDLVWTRNANVLGHKVVWQQAMAEAKKFKIDGHGDWRLPTTRELSFLVHSVNSPRPDLYLKSIGFTNISEDNPWYWTRNEGVFLMWPGAEIVSPMSGGETIAAKTDNYYVWLVRK